MTTLTVHPRRTVNLPGVTQKVELEPITCGDVTVYCLFVDDRKAGSVQKIGGRWSAATRTGRSVKRHTRTDALVGLLAVLGVR